MREIECSFNFWQVLRIKDDRLRNVEDQVWNILIGDSARMNLASEYPSNQWTVINVIVQKMATGDLTAIARTRAPNLILSHCIFRRIAA
jgi:hypothetical protein